MKKLSFFDIQACIYQRIVKYPILFEAILKYTNNNLKEYQILSKIIEECKVFLKL